MTFELSRKKYPEFIYNGFNLVIEDKNLKVQFDFQIPPDVKFKSEIIFPNIAQDINIKDLNNLIFNLGMIELVSYWKATCSPKIIVKAGFLNEHQIVFWKNLLTDGLGEFFYQNKIDPSQKDLVTFEITSTVPQFPKVNKALLDRDLILVGGGKDSALTLDLLRKSKRESNALALNPTKSALEIIKIAGFKNPILVYRKIDRELLELNKKGYLNGHTPFSAYLAFVSLVCAFLYDYKNVIVSNEASSNEGNITWHGKTINHQYSKTYQFENLFRNYAKKYLLTDANYFSFLRPLLELQIAAIFAKKTKFHKIFKSCNVGSKTSSWCRRCPKCISSFLSLYPFLGDKTKEIFGKNILEDKSSVAGVLGLLRINNILKPFECVATVEETKIAIDLGIKRALEDNKRVPVVLESLKKYQLNEPEILKSWDKENNLPEEFKNILTYEIKRFRE